MSVYAIRCNEYVKIGKADCPIARMTMLQIGNPYALRLDLVIRCESDVRSFSTERSIHSAIRSSRVRGEWYCISEKELCVVLRELGIKYVTGVDYVNAEATSDSVVDLDRASKSMLMLNRDPYSDPCLEAENQPNTRRLAQTVEGRGQRISCSNYGKIRVINDPVQH